MPRRNKRGKVCRESSLWYLTANIAMLSNIPQKLCGLFPEMRGLLPFFGIRTAGASDEDLHRGRRRVVALSGFLTFILAVAAATSQNWVAGGLEYTFTTVAEAPLCESCGVTAPSLGATVRIEFALGLSTLGQSTEYDYPYTGERATRDCIFDVEPYVRNINAAAVSNDTSPRNIWYGAEQIPVGKFNSTLGVR